MGWGKWLLLGDLGQQLDIEDQKTEIDRMRSEMSRLRSSGGGDLKLQEENDELRLYLAALIRLLVAKGTITGSELTQIVEAIDKEDGYADGRYRGSIG